MKPAAMMIAAALAIPAALTCDRAHAGPAWENYYEFTGNMELGAPGFFDYLTYDPVGHRLYASHVDKISVVDVTHGTIVGQVGPMQEAHGIAIVPRLGKGYAASGGDGVLKVFRLSDLKVIKEIKLVPDCDGAIFDQATGTVLVVTGDGKTLFVVDPQNDRVSRTVALPEKPEFLAADRHGMVYVNLSETAKIAKIDVSSGKIMSIWQLEHCKDPHGLAYDNETNVLFSGCSNKTMVVVDASTGKNLAALPIGPMSDSVVADAKRHVAISANVNGTMSVIREAGNGRFVVAHTIPTFFGGRNMTIDPTTGDLFVSHGHMTLESSLKDLLNLRFGWDGLDVAMFRPMR